MRKQPPEVVPGGLILGAIAELVGVLPLREAPLREVIERRVEIEHQAVHDSAEEPLQVLPGGGARRIPTPFTGQNPHDRRLREVLRTPSLRKVERAPRTPDEVPGPVCSVRGQLSADRFPVDLAQKLRDVLSHASSAISPRAATPSHITGETRGFCRRAMANFHLLVGIGNERRQTWASCTYSALGVTARRSGTRRTPNRCWRPGRCSRSIHRTGARCRRRVD